MTFVGAKSCLLLLVIMNTLFKEQNRQIKSIHSNNVKYPNFLFNLIKIMKHKKQTDIKLHCFIFLWKTKIFCVTAYSREKLFINNVDIEVIIILNRIASHHIKFIVTNYIQNFLFAIK